MPGTKQPTGRSRATNAPWSGELVIQNGRQSGARRPLHVPLTFVGRNPRCEVRLNVDGVDPMHCLIVHGPDGLMIRDLDSSSGTFVNGERVNNCALKDGDLLAVGPFQFRLYLPPVNLAWPESADADSGSATDGHDAVRTQAAAVAAQQAALDEEEARLLTHRTALERQEEQLATHLEEKRRKLVLLNERAQAERQALQQDRLTYQQQLARITGDLTQSQRDVLERQEKLKQKRQRLARLLHRIRQRLHEQWQAERCKIEARERALADGAAQLQQERQRLHEREQHVLDEQLHFSGEYEKARQQLKAAWEKLRRAQKNWRQRRAQENAILKDRARELNIVAQDNFAVRQQLERDKQDQERHFKLLAVEADGLEVRIKNQRRKIIEQELEINRQLHLLHEKQASAENGGDVDAGTGASVTAGKNSRGGKGAKSARGRKKPGEPATPEALPLPGLEQEFHRRMSQLDALAGDLGDQRLQILEHWGRLAQAQIHWDKEHAEVAAQLDAHVTRLQQQEQTLKQREHIYDEADAQIRQRHRELVHLRQHLVAWRSRLKTRENLLEGERNRLLTEVRHREELAARHLSALVDVRNRWAKRRRQELEWLRGQREACESIRQEYAEARLHLNARVDAFEQEKRSLAEKALALEELRQEYFTRIDQAAGERRLERLRRRWLTQHANLSRATVQERENLHAELVAAETRFAELQKRADAVAHAEAEFAEKKATFENMQALEVARQARLEHEIRSAEDQRLVMEQNLVKMKEEVDRIARQLLEEPDLPATSPPLAA